MSALINRRRVLLGAVATIIAPAGLDGQARAANGTVHTVEIRSLKYLPEELVVSPGDQVRWINRDIAPHTATALNRSWDTGKIGLGDAVTLDVSDEVPTYYFCAFHPHMWGKLRIV